MYIIEYINSLVGASFFIIMAIVVFKGRDTFLSTKLYNSILYR